MTNAEFYCVIALSLGVVVVAGVLLVWLWRERQSRETDLNEEDRGHFNHQDFRRGFVVAILVLLAPLILVGSGLEPQFNGRPNAWFLSSWLGVTALIIILISLALQDWLATRRYAIRKKRALLREGLAIASDEIRARAMKPGNGQAHEDAGGLAPRA